MRESIFQLLEMVCLSLENKGIPYMLSGSLALNIYTIPRMTRDIDMVIQLENQAIPSFLTLFEQDFYYHLPAILEAVKNQGMFNVIHHQSGYKIDFIIRKDTPFRQLEFQRRKKMSALGFEAWIVSAEDLILSKLIWIQELQSERQLDDIKNLLEYPNLDWVYLKRWCQNLNLNTYGLINDE